MSRRARHYVVTGATVVLAIVYARLAGAWSDAEYYGGAAGLIVLVGAFGLPWLEFAPDGAFRRRPRA
jgi:hypothetical protein